jgi:hypothetical protein
MQQPGKYRVTRRAQVPRRSFDKLAAGEASPRRMELVGPASGVVANDCTTKFENAHGTEFRELLYPWHPWAGLSVDVHESVEKPDGVVFRCSVRGRRLEIPAWMFDRSTCARVRVAADVHVNLAALDAASVYIIECAAFGRTRTLPRPESGRGPWSAPILSPNSSSTWALVIIERNP